METKKTINGTELTIKSARIGQYAAILPLIETHIPHIQEIISKNNDTDLSDKAALGGLLLSLLATIGADLIKAISIFSDIDYEFVYDLSPEDFGDLIATIIDVNDFEGLKKGFGAIGKSLQSKGLNLSEVTTNQAPKATKK
jgi:hypothetical protein